MVESTSECWIRGGGQRVGAMCWRSHELEPYDTAPRPFPHLGVMTPAGLVCLDCPQTEPPHEHWTRTGHVPRVTVTPSLNVNNEEWHGHLTAGALVR